MPRLPSRWTVPLLLPGFLPDAVPFALRTAASLLLAYAIAFWAQIEAASTAGICVTIVAQPSAGMAFSKARYRLGGTVIGGIMAVFMLGLFPQDRTMLLIAYGAWLGICTFVGTLLRDFRSYGAMLSGYTVGVVAIAYIDAPQSGLIAAMDRVAAIGLGIACVLLVNLVFASTGAFQGLLNSLRQQDEAVAATVANVLDGGTPPDALTLLGTANGISALRAQATFAGTELPDGAVRSNGARHAIEALLSLLTAGRALSLALAEPVSAAWRNHAAAVARHLRNGSPIPEPPPAGTATEVALLQEMAEAVALRAESAAGLRTLEFGGPALRHVRVEVSYDWVGALLGMVRSCIAIGLISFFTILGGYSAATLLLIQATAIIALLGATPNPTQASLPFAFVLPPLALLVGVMKFVLLTLASGFVPFALVVGPVTFACALLVRHERLAPFGAPTLLYFTLLLSPSNPQTFSFVTYCNTVMELALATVFVLLTFRLILPVSPPRRLGRAAAQIVRQWRRGSPGARPLSAGLLYDQLSRAVQWLGRPTPARKDLLARLYAAGELDQAERRVREALAEAEARPALSAAAGTARRDLSMQDPAGLMRSAQHLLDTDEGAGTPAVRRSVAGLVAAALTLRRFPGLVRFGDRLAS